MQTNADRSKEYVAVEKEYVAVEKEIQKHPHQGSLGGRERTKREEESRREVEKEVVVRRAVGLIKRTMTATPGPSSPPVIGCPAGGGARSPCW